MSSRFTALLLEEVYLTLVLEQVPAILEHGFHTFGAGLSDTSFGASSRNSGARFFILLEQVFLTL